MSVTEIFYAQPVTVATEAAKVTTVTQVEELIYVKSVRAFALCVIVTLHVAFPLIHLYNSISYSEWWMGNYFYIWGKIGSPLFTMVSGLLLLNPAKDQPLSLFFRKRFMKVLLPFAAWSVIYLIWRIYLRGESFTPWEMMVLFVQGPVYYHLWFIQMILGLYLATPILRIYIRHATRQNLTYFLIVWLVTVSILPIIKRFFDFEVGIDITVTTGYVGFFVLGYYLRDITLTRRQIMASLLVVVASLLFTQYVTYAMTVRNNGAFDNFFVLNDSFNLVILAVSLFLFF
jgi:surface polysaccharide O-acyltransferase-like enzyme